MVLVQNLKFKKLFKYGHGFFSVHTGLSAQRLPRIVFIQRRVFLRFKAKFKTYNYYESIEFATTRLYNFFTAIAWEQAS